ncbi:MAG TPA: polysaccharide lyase family 8 super-sandwich domain-containing protein [Candidatus Sulfotelmatobacter sp.]|jgi:hyaluronate lyase|nr:polysaccharide lyase family 8 super-sandwich domain-containing protein [Candidatus Sulfotelmatobacter sp.]
MKIKIFCLLYLLLLPGLNYLRADEFDTLRTYWQNYLINNGGGVSSITSTANSDWSSMNTSPTRTYLWSDLPLGSVSANITGTFQRLQAMALAYATPGSSLQGNSSLAAAVGGGLDWMTTNVYTTTATEYDNWFHWEDSGPMALDDAMLLLYPALTGTQITNYCVSIDHFNPYSPYATFGWMTGANTSDKGLVMLLRGIAGRSTNSMVTAQTNLSPVFLYVTTGDGFYSDGSFVFHSNGTIDGIAYNGHYGLVLLGDIPEIVDLLQNSTDWKITDPNLANVYAWVTNSFEPFLYNGTMMDTVRGRIVSWSYETESGDGSSTLGAMGQIGQFAPPAIGTAFTNFINSPRLASGQFHFPSMGREVALRSGFGFAISMESSRTADYESINSGNLHGWHQGDGMNYLYIGSTENQFNSDFWPTVDPYHLPGTTAETNTLGNSANQTKTTDQNWVGGAQVAKTYGVAGMSLHPLSTTVSGRKSWFMLDNEIVCLGAGITCGDATGVDTTAENRRLGNPITQTFTLNGTNITPATGWSSNLPVATASWCALSGTGGYYIPAGNSNLVASFTANTGSWSQINSGDDSTSRTDDYFRLCYHHGTTPTNASYSYIILPNATTTTVSNYANAPDILILSNTPAVQAVKKVSLGVVAANFWTNGNSSADLISVNNKSSVITWENTNGISIGVSDPTQTNSGSITVTLNRAAVGLLSADPGITVQQLSPQVIFSANVNGSAGKSLQAAFSYSGPGIPIISSVYPNGTNLCQSTNTLSFNLAAGAGIATSNIIVTLNGIVASNLVFSGSSTNWNVGCPLAPNTVYTAVITATDTNGNVATMTSSFDTFSFGNYVLQAEDFDYNGGHYIDNPQTNAYAGLVSITNVDTHQVNFAGTDIYRKNGMDTEVNGDLVSPPYIGTGKTDYSIGYFSAGAWANYTRHFPAGSYNLYARLAAGGGATTCTLSRVTGGWGTTSQTTNLLGTFSIPNTAWETYGYIPLKDNSGNLVTVKLDGSTNTLRLVRPGSATADCNANFLMLIPIFAASAAPNGTNVSISFPTQAGFNYQVLYKNQLTDPTWLPLGSALAGNNFMQTFNDPPGANTRFYRVQIQ